MNITSMGSNTDAENSTPRKPSILMEGFSLLLCLSTAFVILAFVIFAPYANATLTKYSKGFLDHWKPHFSASLATKIPTNSPLSKEYMIIFNPKIKLSQVLFRRDPKEGAYRASINPLYLNYEDVKNFTDGEVTTSDNTTIYVEQDAEQINNLLVEKIREREEYESEMRKFDRMGVEPDHDSEAQ